MNTSPLNMPPRIQSPLLAGLPAIAHGFFTRRGGVSSGIYASLNCGPGSGDDPAAVAENRRRAAAALRQGCDAPLSVHQVHGNTAIYATAPWPGEERPRADAMVTDRPGLVIGVLTADCAPVLMADPEAGIVAAAHSGWKGALAGIVEATVAVMESRGARRENIYAAIGPCIGPRSYEVGPEFPGRFDDPDIERAAFFRPAATPGKWLFDLPGFAAFRLRQAGIRHVADIGRDTLENEDLFFSYRRATLRGEADYGRQISAICLT